VGAVGVHVEGQIDARYDLIEPAEEPGKALKAVVGALGEEDQPYGIAEEAEGEYGFVA